MSQPKESFRFPDRATYELGYLLRALPRHLHGESLTEQQLADVGAAELHAMNSTNTLVRGLQGLGHVIWSACNREEMNIDHGHVGQVGLLVSEIALQLQFLDEFRQSVVEHEMRMANAERDAAEHARALAAQRETTDLAARVAGLQALDSRAGGDGGAA